MRRFVLPRDRGLYALLGGLTFYLVVITAWPLGRLLAEVFLSVKGNPPFVKEVLTSPASIRALKNTTDAAFWASTLSVLVGTLGALLVTLTDIRSKRILSFLILLPMLIPSQITALAWKMMVDFVSKPGSPNPLYSREGVILVLGIEHSTLVFLSVRASLQGLSWDLVEAARVLGARPLRITRTVILPLAAPGIIAGFALSFVAGIGNFGVPALLGIPGKFPVLTTLIYRKLNGFGPSVLGETAILSLVLMGLAGLGLSIRSIASRRVSAAHTKTQSNRSLFPLGTYRLPVEGVVILFYLCISILPLLSLAATSFVPAVGVLLTPDTFTLGNYRAGLSQDAVVRAFSVSLKLSAFTAFLCVGVSIPLAYCAAIRKVPLSHVLVLLADAPYAIPGIVVSISMILAFLKPLPLLGSLYGTAGILFVAYASRFLSLALMPTLAGAEQFDRDLEEAAAAVGGRTFRRLRTIVFPSVLPSAFSGGLLVFMAALNEITVSSLLWSSGTETIGVMIYAMHYEGNSPQAAAISMISVLIVLTIALTISHLGKSLPEGVIPWRS